MGTSFKVPGFGGGLVSPQLLGRSDQNKYAVGLRTCVNAWITRYGTIENRPGTFYDDVIDNDGEQVRLIRFTSEVAQGILLVFGDEWVRFFKNGEPIAHPTSLGAWSGVTDYLIGQVVTYSGVDYLAITDSTNAQPDVSPISWYPQASADLEWPTVIGQASLATFQTAQINDIMYITGHAFTPQTIQRYADDSWYVVEFLPEQGIDPPGTVTVTPGQPTNALHKPSGVSLSGGSAVTPGSGYVITAYDNNPGQESAATTSQISTGLASNSEPVTISWSAASGANGYAIYRSDANDEPFGLIGVTDDLMFVDSRQLPNNRGATAIKTIDTQTTGGSREFSYVVTAVDDDTGTESFASATAEGTGSNPTNNNPNVVSWTAVSGAASYNVYKASNGVYGYIGSSVTLTFRDINITPDTAQQPPTEIPMFQTSSDYPAVCGTYQQRLFFANSINEPQTVWGSAVGVYSSFADDIPTRDNGSIVFTIAADIRQYIMALIDLGKLIIHTNNGEYTCGGNQAGTLTPNEITLTNTGSSGSAIIRPVVVGNTDVSVQEGATRLLDLRYDVQSFSYNGKDLTKFAPSIFAGKSVVSMDWQKLPHSIIWCVLDDGTMAALTYVREDDLWAWHQHTTDGFFEQVCVITEGSAHVVYVVVRREIDGNTVRYLENLAPRDVLDTETFADAYFPDSAQLYDGRNTSAVTMTATSTGTWTTDDVLTVTASTGSTFSAASVGDALIFQDLDPITGLVDEFITFNIIGYTSPTVVSVTPQADVPTWAQATPLTTWGTAVTDFTGIGHLEGESLSIFADGSVVADPLDDGYPVIAVSSGGFTLPSPAMVVCAGLPVQMDVQTLPIENATGESISDKRVTLNEVTPIFYASRGGLYGQDFDHLTAWVQPPTSTNGDAQAAATGPYRIPVKGAPQNTAQVAMRLTNPVPWSISAVVAKITVGN